MRYITNIEIEDGDHESICTFNRNLCFDKGTSKQNAVKSNQVAIVIKTYLDLLFAVKMGKWDHPVAALIIGVHVDSTTDARKTQNVL